MVIYLDMWILHHDIWIGYNHMIFGLVIYHLLVFVGYVSHHVQ
jgi:hypothetical protein